MRIKALFLFLVVLMCSCTRKDDPSLYHEQVINVIFGTQFGIDKEATIKVRYYVELRIDHDGDLVDTRDFVVAKGVRAYSIVTEKGPDLTKPVDSEVSDFKETN